MRARHSDRGFTLVELLMGMAIFAVVMTGIVALFVASIRAVKTSYQASEANELARGVFNTIERDLTQGFTAREFGDFYQFHGTPMGYSMIGVVRAREQYTSLGRVSFVVHPNPKIVPIPTTAEELQDVSDFELSIPPIPGELIAYVNDILSRTPSDAGSPRPGATHKLEQFVRFYFRDPGRFNRFLSAEGDELIFTASALRFVEMGPTTLDAFPFDWSVLTTDPEFGSVIAGAFADLDENFDAYFVSQFGSSRHVNEPDAYAALGTAGKQLVDARRRTVYLNMLRGDPELGFDLWDYMSSLRGYEMDPEDYVVAERIEIARWNLDPAAVSPLTVGAPFFLYGNQQRIEDYTSPSEGGVTLADLANDTVIFDDGTNSVALTGELMPAGYDFQVIDRSVDWKLEWLTPGYLDPGAVVMGKDWPASHPLFVAGAVVPNMHPPASGFATETAFDATGTLTGDIRLPELVLVRFPLMFDSPYVGAPDYRRTITQTYDLSAGLARGDSG
jgi:prepilin-type N-terminal cleavage/methylation domain-containing protein